MNRSRVGFEVPLRLRLFLVALDFSWSACIWMASGEAKSAKANIGEGRCGWVGIWEKGGLGALWVIDDGYDMA